jgi:cation transport ATPase
VNECLLAGAALAAGGSNHPVSQAIATKHVAGTYLLRPESLVEIPGESIKGCVHNLADADAEYQIIISRPSAIQGIGPSSKISMKSINMEMACIVELEDKIRPGVTDAIKQSTIPLYMLTGDNRESALKIASGIGLDPSGVFAGLRPDDKAKIIYKLPMAMMVGDGVNDAPALAAAPAGGVSIASSSHSESIQTAAVAVADAVVLTSPSTNPIDAVSFLVTKSRATDKIVKQNIAIGFAGMIGTVSAVLGGGCPLWLAVLLHEGSTVLVVLNSLRNR